MLTQAALCTKIALLDKQIDGLGKTGPELCEMSDSLDMGLDEFCRFQELKSLAVANGIISPEAGQTIYRFLGESPSTFNDQNIATKVVLTKLFAELLGG